MLGKRDEVLDINEARLVGHITQIAEYVRLQGYRRMRHADTVYLIGTPNRPQIITEAVCFKKCDGFVFMGGNSRVIGGPVPSLEDGQYDLEKIGKLAKKRGYSLMQIERKIRSVEMPFDIISDCNIQDC